VNIKYRSFILTSVLGFLVIGVCFISLCGVVRADNSKATIEQEKKISMQLDAPKLSRVTTAADYKVVLERLDGKPFSLDELKGKTILLNFWATWCPPCRAEMPSIQRLYDQMKGEVAFVLVSSEDKSQVVPFINERKYTFPVYILKGDTPAVYESRGIPITFIISPEGNIVIQDIGSARWDDPKVIQFLRSLNKGKTVTPIIKKTSKKK
jgi:thiol-disulfide isomerase/thioredoxin